MRYPEAPRSPISELIGGHRIEDPYRWLEDSDDPQTVAWSAAQDALARPILDAYPGRTALAASLRTLLSAGQEGPPRPRAGVGFRQRRAPDQQHAVLVAGSLDDPEEFRVLVDPHQIDPSGATTLDAWEPSPDGRLLAYQLSRGGDEESTLSVLDVTTGDVVDGPIDRTRYSPVAWLADSSGFYYVRRLSAESPFDRRVYLHRLGSDPAQDSYVFGEGHDPRTYFGVDVSPDGRWLVISAAIGTAPRDDVWITDLTGSEGDFAVVQQGVDARCYASVEFDGRLYIWTDAGAPRGRLCVADPADPQRWTTLVAEDEEAVLGGYAVLEEEIVLARSRHAIGEVQVISREDGALLRDVTLPGIGSVLGVTSSPEGGTDAWIAYTDALTPPSVLDAEGRVWAAAPGAASVGGVTASVEIATSADGTPVRVQILAPAGHSGPLPTVLYGYGGFAISLEPAYSASALAWAMAGGVWAVAQLRGGGEEGEAWHRAGMREAKQNVFADFEAAARHLRSSGRASALGCLGGSNGGLLVGAAITREPGLYDAAVSSAALLDMVRYERFGLGATWNDEYGTADDPVELGWLLGYSPLHAVQPGVAYPPTLLEVFESDTRVDPLHARKFAAALQWAIQQGHASGGPVLLRRESDVGHGGRSIDRTIGLNVDTLSFLAAQLGLTHWAS
ncbi:MAG TPA: prolyl oligopeptidase family serine peptidase [Frankiaceae bacterium]|nr:prolyl oligopeptidase family serine peptidase [Frankiaceae bacterium]